MFLASRYAAYTWIVFTSIELQAPRRVPIGSPRFCASDSAATFHGTANGSATSGGQRLSPIESRKLSRSLKLRSNRSRCAELRNFRQAASTKCTGFPISRVAAISPSFGARKIIFLESRSSRYPALFCPVYDFWSFWAQPVRHHLSSSRRRALRLISAGVRPCDSSHRSKS